MHDHKKLLKKMQEKGWSKEELDHADIVFSEHESKHQIFHPFFDKFIHIVLFGLMIILNGFAFTLLLPIIALFPLWFTLIIVLMLSVSLGAICSIVLHDLTHLEDHHHLFLYAVVPTSTLVLFLGFLYYLQQSFFLLHFSHPLTIGLLYVAGFILPFIYHRHGFY